MTARDEAIEYGLRLFRVLFQRTGQPLDEQSLRCLVVTYMDLLIEASAEVRPADGFDVLAELEADDDPPPPAPTPVRRYAATPGYERERVPAIPHEVR